MTSPAAHAAPPYATSAAYQRLRLWCGIAGIGNSLVALWLAALAGLAHFFDARFATLPPEAAGAFTAVVLAGVAAMLQAVPDAFAAFVDRHYGRRVSGTLLGPYLMHLVQWTLGVAVAGAVVGFAWRIGGDVWWAWAVPLVLGLAFFHVVVPISPTTRVAAPDAAWWQRVAEHLEEAGLGVPAVAWYASGERTLGGGWNGSGPWRRLFLDRSLADVSPRDAAVLVSRELGHLRLGHRRTTAWCTAAWVTVGLALAGWFAGGGRGPAGVVFVTAVVMSTWCWIGLLGLWPALGRRQVFAADAFAATHLGADATLSALDTLARQNLPDDALPAGVEFVFHPIPPMAKRRARVANVGDVP